MNAEERIKELCLRESKDRIIRDYFHLPGKTEQLLSELQRNPDYLDPSKTDVRDVTLNSQGRRGDLAILSWFKSHKNSSRRWGLVLTILEFESSFRPKRDLHRLGDYLFWTYVRIESPPDVRFSFKEWRGIEVEFYILNTGESHLKDDYLIPRFDFPVKTIQPSPEWTLDTVLGQCFRYSELQYEIIVRPRDYTVDGAKRLFEAVQKEGVFTELFDQKEVREKMLELYDGFMDYVKEAEERAGAKMLINMCKELRDFDRSQTLKELMKKGYSRESADHYLDLYY